MAKGNRGGKRGASGGIKYLSPDKALYESSDEVLYVERMTNVGSNDGEVLDAKSDGNGNITLGYAKPSEYYHWGYSAGNKISYALYEVKCGISNAFDIKGGATANKTVYGNKESKYKSENYVRGGLKSVGINWDKVNSVSGKTYNIKDLLKAKGFKWNSAKKNWVKS